MTVFTEEGIELKHLSAELHSFIIIFFPQSVPRKNTFIILEGTFRNQFSCLEMASLKKCKL